MKDINEYLDAKTVIIIVICLVVAVSFFLCYRQVESLRIQMESSTAERQKNSVLRAELGRLQEQLREGSESNLEEEMIARMPPLPDEPGLIIAVNDAFGDTKGIMIDIQFRERLANDNYIEMPFTIYMSTDYRTLVDVLYNLQNSGRYIQLRGFTISATDELNKLSVVVDASAFSYAS